VKPRVLDILDEIIGECRNSRLQPKQDALAAAGKRAAAAGDDQPGDDRWRIYVTGHSMGGAHATLCAYELAVRSWELQ
jgi:dipeptidyl aminopeptidase/acylaminoacyl peptidase